jgi:hypothetical protein
VQPFQTPRGTKPLGASEISNSNALVLKKNLAWWMNQLEMAILEGSWAKPVA